MIQEFFLANYLSFSLGQTNTSSPLSNYSQFHSKPRRYSIWCNSLRRFTFSPQIWQELLQRGPCHTQQYCEWKQTALHQRSARGAGLGNHTAVDWWLLTGLLSPVIPCQPWVSSALRRITAVKVKLMLQSALHFVGSCLNRCKETSAIGLLKFTFKQTLFNSQDTS